MVDCVEHGAPGFGGWTRPLVTRWLDPTRDGEAVTNGAPAVIRKAPGVMRRVRRVTPWSTGSNMGHPELWPC